MLKKFLSYVFCKRFYPTVRRDWYKNKGYFGNDKQEIFQDFLKSQRQVTGKYYSCFQDLDLARFGVRSGDAMLDCVKISPAFEEAASLPGYGLFIIMFQGRGEYYEARFRDMAMLCRETGASVIGFNPKGFNSSTGKTRILRDIIEDGIALCKHLISEKIFPYQYVFLGNSLGAAVQEVVCAYLIKHSAKGIKQINSNSFRTLSAVVAYKLGIPKFEDTIRSILIYAGWEIRPGRDFYTTGLHRCYMRRYGDQTILPGAEYHSMLDLEKDVANSPDEYRETHIWLNAHATMHVCDKNTKDPHNLGLHRFVTEQLKGDSKQYTVFDFINKYLSFKG